MPSEYEQTYNQIPNNDKNNCYLVEGSSVIIYVTEIRKRMIVHHRRGLFLL